MKPTMRPRHPSRVLVVEDDVGVAALETRALQGDDHQVDIASGVDSALDRLGSGAYSAIVLDYKLQDGDSWTVLDAARASTPPIPVVVVTGAGDERVAAEAIRRGASDYLVKSGQFGSELTTSVARVVRIAAIEHRAALLAKVVEALDDAVFSATLADTITSWNPAAERLFGLSAAEAIGAPYTQLVQFDDADVPARLTAATTGCTAIAPFVAVCGQPDLACADRPLSPSLARCVLPDGTQRELSVTLSVVRDGRGIATSLAFIARDVTAQNRDARLMDRQLSQLAASERDLQRELQAKQAAEARYKLLFDHATVAILVIGPDDRIVEANRQGEQLLGLPYDQIVGRMALDFRVPDGEPLADDPLAPMRAGALLDAAVWPFLHADGSTRMAEVEFTTIDVASERLILAMAKDVTDQAAAERNLRDSEARYASLLTHIPDLIWRSELNGLTTFVSPAVLAITGFTQQEVYDAGLAIWPGRVHEDDAPRVMEGFQTLADGGRFDCTHRLQHKDGHYIWLHGRAVRVQLADGSYVVEGIATDVTQVKRLEEQFLQSQRLEAVGQLTAGIAHDFNNLLSAILAGGSFIAEDLPLDHPSRKDALDIIKAAEPTGSGTNKIYNIITL